jgi:hypothetical protein
MSCNFFRLHVVYQKERQQAPRERERERERLGKPEIDEGTITHLDSAGLDQDSAFKGPLRWVLNVAAANGGLGDVHSHSIDLLLDGAGIKGNTHAVQL